jgi:hypothetical protein
VVPGLAMVSSSEDSILETVNDVGDNKSCLVKTILVFIEYTGVREREISVTDDTNRIAGSYLFTPVSLVAVYHGF